MPSAIEPMLDLKYPRTYHLDFSPGLQNDDRRLPSLDAFLDQEIVVTEKIDGEGTTLTPIKTYPRSPDGRNHPSRTHMKAFWAERAALIPEGWRISGEYAAALHSIPYTHASGNPLPAWFLGFGVWDERNMLLGWDQTTDIFEMLDIIPVPVLYRGPFDIAVLKRIAASLDIERQEGFVVRTAGEIAYPNGPGDAGRFFTSVAKWVRPKHVQTDEHWMSGPVIWNELRGGQSS